MAPKRSFVIQRQISPLPRVDRDFLEARALRHYAAAQGSPLYERLMLPLLARFGLSEDDAKCQFLRYNLGINEETNETYRLLGTQFALLVNYLPPNTWFSRRLDRYAEFVSRFSNIVDVGFGIPFPWLLVASRHRQIEGAFALVDSSQSALDFGAEFIHLVTRQYPKETESLGWSLRHGMIEHADQWGMGPMEAVLALDCVEHAARAAHALQRMASVLSGAVFLIGLPVGTPIPQHTIDFDAEQDAIAFVSTAGLRVTSTHLVQTVWDGDVVGNPGFKGSIFIEAV